MKTRLKTAILTMSASMLIGTIAAFIIHDNMHDILTAITAYGVGVIIGQTACECFDILYNKIRKRKTAM